MYKLFKSIEQLSLTFADMVILGLSLLILLWLYSYYWIGNSAQADYAIIMVDHEISQRIELNHDQIVKVRGILGETVLQVEAGKIRVIASPCTGKQCIHAGWLHISGDFTACLPNRVSIEVHSRAKNQYDAIVY
ncbi:MAG: NusG domain II-containing protein [Thiotrichaceae bacterium]